MTKSKSGKKRKNHPNDQNHSQNKKSKLLDTLDRVQPRAYGVDADIYFEVFSEDLAGRSKMVPMHKEILARNFDFFSAMFDPKSNWFQNGEPKKLNELKLQTFEYFEEYMQSLYQDQAEEHHNHRHRSQSGARGKASQDRGTRSESCPRSGKPILEGLPKNLKKNILVGAYFHFYDSYWVRFLVEFKGRRYEHIE